MKYYTCANTSSGFVDFTEENIFDIDYKIQLICKNSYIKSYVLGFLKGESEKILSVGSKNLTDGIIFRDKNIAVVGSCQNAYKILNLDEYFVISDCEETNSLYEKMSVCYEQAKDIHDEWEKIYISNMDFERLNGFCDRVIKKLVTCKSSAGTGKTYKRFFGTSTVNGPVNYIDNITENLNKRYFIKGRPGTGKSTFLKKLSAELKNNGFDVEEYYCSFDKNSLDMVVSRELSFCIFDSTAPHEKFPKKESDELLNFYVEAGLSGIDEKYESELFFVKSAYENKIREGMEYFKKAWKIKDIFDKEKLSKIDESEMRKISKHIID